MVQTRFKKGSDGKTAWGRMRRSRCDAEVVPFGEMVWYKTLKESGDRQNKMEARWEEGVWLGHEGRTQEFLVGTKDGVVKAWDGCWAPSCLSHSECLVGLLEEGCDVNIKSYWNTADEQVEMTPLCWAAMNYC